TAIVVCLALSTCVGPGGVTPGDAAQVLAAHLTGQESDNRLTDALVWALRVPRALLVALAGAALACAGAVTQGLFRNPMAEPGVLGVSTGAAVLAVAGMFLGLDTLGIWVTPLLAGLGAGFSLILLLTLVGPRRGIATLLLAGIALAAIGSALTTLLLALAGARWDLGLKMIGWLMGSFEGRSWDHLYWGVGPILAGLGLAMWLHRDLDILLLGDETARSLGVDMPAFRRRSVACIALLVGTTTAVAGVIGFVGLVVPHMIRIGIGPRHRRLLPASAAGGALLVLLVDIVSRSSSEVVLPPGAITSLIGAPVFLWLLRRRQL
ncbi:MAG: FecCD family ABC transporter permease, partial [Nannocystaceae bacterium]